MDGLREAVQKYMNGDGKALYQLGFVRVKPNAGSDPYNHFINAELKLYLKKSYRVRQNWNGPFILPEEVICQDDRRGYFWILQPIVDIRNNKRAEKRLRRLYPDVDWPWDFDYYQCCYYKRKPYIFDR